MAHRYFLNGSVYIFKNIIHAITKVGSKSLHQAVERGVWKSWAGLQLAGGRSAVLPQTMWAAPWSSPDEVTNLGEEKKQKTLEIYGRELRSVTSRGHRGKRLRWVCEGGKALESSDVLHWWAPGHRSQEQKQDTGPTVGVQRLSVELWMDLGLPDPMSSPQRLQRRCLFSGRNQKKWAFCLRCFQSENSCSRADCLQRSPKDGRRGRELSDNCQLQWLKGMDAASDTPSPHLDWGNRALVPWGAQKREKKTREDLNEWSSPSSPTIKDDHESPGQQGKSKTQKRKI